MLNPDELFKKPITFPPFPEKKEESVVAPVTVPVLEPEPNVEEMKEELEYAKILRAHGGLESNIPINHKYWKIRP